MRKVLFLVVCTIFLLNSCNKYENGPKFTLLSKKARLANSWKLVRATLNGEILQFNSNAYTNTTIIGKDGTYEILAESSQNGYTNQYGTWEFGEDKETIIIDLEPSGFSNEYTISKLKDKELWLKKEVSSGTYLYEYVPK